MLQTLPIKIQRVVSAPPCHVPPLRFFPRTLLARRSLARAPSTSLISTSGPWPARVIVIGRYWGCSFHQVWEYPYLGGFAAGILSLPSISCKKYVINTISTLCSIMFFAFFPLPREPSSVVNLQMAVFCQQLSTVHMPYPGMHSSPYKARMTMVLVIEHFINLWW